MALIAELAVPLIMLAVGISAVMQKKDAFSALTRGGMEGLKTVAEMLPALVVLFPAVYMLRASGAIDALARLLSPVMNAVGVPPETASLMLLRPISGGAATAAATDIIKNCGADSLAGRTAAVMMGSSETTFYVIAIYFGAAKIKMTRWAIPAALCADLAVFLASAYVCRILWG